MHMLPVYLDMWFVDRLHCMWQSIATIVSGGHNAQCCESRPLSDLYSRSNDLAGHSRHSRQLVCRVARCLMTRTGRLSHAWQTEW